MTGALSDRVAGVKDTGTTALPKEIRFKGFRGDVNGGGMVGYVVPAVPGMVVLDAIHWIQTNLAGDLAVRWNCKAAKCGSCSAEINGFPKLMWKTRIDDLPEGEVRVQPLRTFPPVKDLVPDVAFHSAQRARA